MTLTLPPPCLPGARGAPPSGRGGEAGGEADGGAAGGVAAGLRPLLPHATLLEDGPRDAGQLEAPPAGGGAVEPGGLRPDLQVGLVVVVVVIVRVVMVVIVRVVMMMMMMMMVVVMLIVVLTDCQHHHMCC